MKREYRAQARYGYVGIDLFMGDSCRRTVLTGIKPQKLGYQIADALQRAYEQGRSDAFDVVDWDSMPSGTRESVEQL